MRARWLVGLALATSCTHEQAPRARTAGEVMAIGGVVGIVASALARSVVSHSTDLVIGFSAVSAAGIITYAFGELTDPAFADEPAETLEQRHHRWAKILTSRAAGAAREGNCVRVRRLEVHVRNYDPETHDFVFMRDPEIVRCLEAPP